MSSENSIFRHPIFNVWMISHLIVLAIILPLITLTDPEWNLSLIIIQIIASVIILVVQNLYHRWTFNECVACGQIRLFHDRKRYAHFESIVCGRFTKNRREIGK